MNSTNPPNISGLEESYVVCEKNEVLGEVSPVMVEKSDLASPGKEEVEDPFGDDDDAFGDFESAVVRRSSSSKKSNDVQILKKKVIDVDLWSIIVEESLRTSTILKEGPVFMMRMGGFPKKWTRKQVWMVLTTSGVIIKKDQKDNKLHHIFSFHRPLALNPSDTLEIGLNGLAMIGTAPVSLQDHDAVKESVLMKVDYIPANVIISEASESKARFEKTSSRIEIAFENKDVMNEWMDAIWTQFETFQS